MRVIPINAHADITGFESPDTEYTQLSLDLDMLLVEHPSATFIGCACGNSIQGVGIFDQDLLNVDRHVDVKHNDVIVANLNGEFICKQIDIHRKLLLSANDKYQSSLINECYSFSLESVVAENRQAREAGIEKFKLSFQVKE
ncbi:S24 family peptidase [Vibrio harveyi]|uniref:S24 family peptidase n=1 Tax=Vibrio harveyi TaxID=669 RepID=UPI0036F27208